MLRSHLLMPHGTVTHWTLPSKYYSPRKESLQYVYLDGEPKKCLLVDSLSFCHIPHCNTSSGKHDLPLWLGLLLFHLFSLLVLIIPTSFCLLLCFIWKSPSLLFLPVLYLTFPRAQKQFLGLMLFSCLSFLFRKALVKYAYFNFWAMLWGSWLLYDHLWKHRGPFEPQLTWASLYNSSRMFGFYWGRFGSYMFYRLFRNFMPALCEPDGTLISLPDMLLKKKNTVHLLFLGDFKGFLWEWKSAKITLKEKFFGAHHQNKKCNIRRPV